MGCGALNGFRPFLCSVSSPLGDRLSNAAESACLTDAWNSGSCGMLRKDSGHVLPLRPQVRHWADLAAAAGQLLAQTLFARRPGVHVVHITSEMVPVAKVSYQRQLL